MLAEPDSHFIEAPSAARGSSPVSPTNQIQWLRSFAVGNFCLGCMGKNGLAHVHYGAAFSSEMAALREKPEPGYVAENCKPTRLIRRVLPRLDWMEHLL